MKLKFEIIEYDQGQGILYTAKFNDQEDCELERFLTDEECSKHPEFGDLQAFMLDLVDRLGFQRRFFEQEKYKRRHGPSLGYLSYYSLNRRNEYGEKKWLRLRLYCCWLSEQVLIAGMGCVKEVPGPLDNVDSCKQAFERMCLVDSIIGKKIEKKEIIIADRIEYDDDLVFEGELHG